MKNNLIDFFYFVQIKNSDIHFYPKPKTPIPQPCCTDNSCTPIYKALHQALHKVN